MVNVDWGEKLIHIKYVNPAPLPQSLVCILGSGAVLSVLLQLFWYRTPNVENYASLKCSILAITELNPEKWDDKRPGHMTTVSPHMVSLSCSPPISGGCFGTDEEWQHFCCWLRTLIPVLLLEKLAEACMCLWTVPVHFSKYPVLFSISSRVPFSRPLNILMVTNWACFGGFPSLLKCSDI